VLDVVENSGPLHRRCDPEPDQLSARAIIGDAPAMADKKASVFDDGNPEWTQRDFMRARSASEVMPPEFMAAFRKIPRFVHVSPRAAQNAPF